MANPKLTQAQVLAIREALRAGEKGLALARQYKVHRQTIYGIKYGKTWRKLKRGAA